MSEMNRMVSRRNCLKQPLDVFFSISIRPAEVGFVNQLLTKKSLREIIGNIIKWTNVPKTAKFLDDIKTLGFRMAFRGGLSFNINDLIIPDTKEELLVNAKGEVDEVWDNYNMGLITNNERYNQIVDIWTRVDTRITETLIRELSIRQAGIQLCVYDA